MRLLVVEDDKDLNRQIVTALKQAGYAVDRAFDGEEGQFLGDTEPYDAVVLDLGLPKIDGVTVLAKWRRGRPQDAGADPHRARPLERQGGGLRCRRRRLCRQALPHGGGAGAHPRAAAPRGGPCHERDLVCGPVVLDTHAGRGDRRWQAGEAHLARVSGCSPT